MTSTSPRDTLRADITGMLSELRPLLRAAADAGDQLEISRLLERRDGLLRLLEHVPHG